MTEEEILKGLYDNTLIGNAPEVKDLTNHGLEQNVDPETMLYDALVTNLDVAERTMAAKDLHTANRSLVKAQAILIELRSSLKPELWSAGPRLAALYEYLIREVVQANVTKDAKAVRACRLLIEPLRDAWHVAAREVAAQA